MQITEVTYRNEDVCLQFSDNFDAKWYFHIKWLRDSCCDNGFSRSTHQAFSSNISNPSVDSIKILQNNHLAISWKNSNILSTFPAIWLRVMAPYVAKLEGSPATPTPAPDNLWFSDHVEIPHIAWDDIMSGSKSDINIENIINLLLDRSYSNLIKITNLPAPDYDSERRKVNTLVTQILKKIFGSVYFHPRRGANKTFNVTSREENSSRMSALDNYDLSKELLPHTDHAHYIHPIKVMGLYCLEGTSTNTWLDGFSALEILKNEDIDCYDTLCHAPTCYGRIAHYYEPSLYQANTDTPITLYPGTKKIKRIKWHPHLAGWIHSSFEYYNQAITSYQKFQEIIMRPSIKLEVLMKPGDLYLWNNFRVLHGRQNVIETPRTTIGQTVSEEVVMNRYREIKIKNIKTLDDSWLAHTPTDVLNDIIDIETRGI